jgi:hypothetical protein
MHGRKRLFTVTNGDRTHDPYTGTVYGRIRLQYASLFRSTLEMSEYTNSKYF